MITVYRLGTENFQNPAQKEADRTIETEIVNLMEETIFIR